jgi:hypothetical protein
MKSGSDPTRANLLYNVPMPLASVLSVILLLSGSGVMALQSGQKLRTAQDDYAAAAKLVQGSLASTLLYYETGEDLREAISELKKEIEQLTPDDAKYKESSEKEIQTFERVLRSLPAGPGRPTRLDIDRLIAQEFEPAWQKLLAGNRNPVRAVSEPNAPSSLQFLVLIPTALRKMRFELANGDGAGAVQTYHETFKFTQRLDDTEFLERVVMVVCEQNLINELDEMLLFFPSNGLTELIQTISQSGNGRPRLQKVLANLRTSAIQRTDLMEQDFERDPMHFIDAWSKNNDLRSTEYTTNWRTTFERLVRSSPVERSLFFQKVREKLKRAFESFGQMLTRPEHDWDFKGNSTLGSTPVNQFVSFYTDSFPYYARHESEARTRCRIAAITLAAREFAWQQGRFPTNLSEFLTKAEAHDPLNNKPFQYSIEQGNIVVKTAVHPILGQITLRKLPADPAAARRPKRP